MTSPDANSNDDALSAGERRLLDAASTGQFVDLRPTDSNAADVGDPSQGMTWDTGRIIRASVLIRLLTGIQPGIEHPRSVKVFGARITGHLDLEAATLVCPLWLCYCYLDKPVNLSEATAPAIRMLGCHLPALQADRLQTTGDLILAAEFTVSGEVNLSHARIGGNLNFKDALLDNPHGVALRANGIVVSHDLRCSGDFTAHGAISLAGGHIGGQFSLSGASLSSEHQPAMQADELRVEQSMHCADGFTAEGEICLGGAQIGSTLSMHGAELSNQGGRALSADGLAVSKNVHFSQGFAAYGGIWLRGARIGGQLDLTGAVIASKNGVALNAERLTADDVLCMDDFAAVGELRFVGARISGQFILCDAAIANIADAGGTVLALDSADIATLILMPGAVPEGAVSLNSARTGDFIDNRSIWPNVKLDGFVYDRLVNDKVTVRERLQWIRSSTDYKPQAYDQLAAAYQHAGNEQAARKVAIAKQWHRRRTLNPLNWLWYATVGYGYRTWLAGVWLVGLTALGTWVFSGAYPAHMAALSARPPAFHAAAYVLDLLLPVIGLGQKSAWQPQGSAYLYWSWALNGAGWVLTTAVVAGLTGILKRN